jgi:hypothetical protein
MTVLHRFVWKFGVHVMWGSSRTIIRSRQIRRLSTSIKAHRFNSKCRITVLYLDSVGSLGARISLHSNFPALSVALLWWPQQITYFRPRHDYEVTWCTWMKHTPNCNSKSIQTFLKGPPQLILKSTVLSFDNNLTGSETTLNYWMMVDKYPNFKKEVGNLIPGCETSSLLDEKLVRWVNCLLYFGVCMSTFCLKIK